MSCFGFTNLTSWNRKYILDWERRRSFCVYMLCVIHVNHFGRERTQKSRKYDVSLAFYKGHHKWETCGAAYIHIDRIFSKENKQKITCGLRGCWGSGHLQIFCHVGHFLFELGSVWRFKLVRGSIDEKIYMYYISQRQHKRFALFTILHLWL